MKLHSQKPLHRTRVRALSGVALSVLLIGSIMTSAQAAPNRATAKVADKVVGTDRTVTAQIRCTGTKKCTGTARLKSKNVTTSLKNYSIKAGKTKNLTFTVSNAQYKKLVTKKKLSTALVLSQAKPAKKTTKTQVTLKAATRKVAAKTKALTFNAAGKTTITLSCARGANCSGNFTPVVAGEKLAKQKYSIKAGKTKKYALTLTATAHKKLTTKSTSAQLRVSENKPERFSHNLVITAKKAVVVKPTPTPTHTDGHGDHTDPGSGTGAGTNPGAGSGTEEPNKYSVAYTDRNWTPTQYDSCSAELHASYNTVGPDGLIYPTWHPAQGVDPTTGETCTFGHEHGANPATSDIYEWVLDYLSPENEAATGLPFGYASEELNTYAHHHAGMSMRHEDNAGHKVFLANNVTLYDANKKAVTFINDSGQKEAVTCDYLIKQHQGSWSPDATSNNAHELIYASKCTDGTEIITTMLSRFGNSNEFTSNCGTNNIISTVGSTLPAGDGGSREIPDAACLKSALNSGSGGTWAIYELWQGDNKIKAADGTVLAEFDPWFGLRNPSRYYNSANSNATTNGISRTVDLAWNSGYGAIQPWKAVASGAQLDWRDPASPFDGAQRDFYLNQNKVSAANPSEQIFTDPYGKNASTETFQGAIKQHLKAGSATTGSSLMTQKFDSAADYGNNNGVHAPN